MDSLERRLLGQMINQMAGFRAGSMSLGDLVGNLEGLLDAGDFRNADFLQVWWDLVSLLEEAYDQDADENPSIGRTIDQLEQHVRTRIDAGG